MSKRYIVVAALLAGASPWIHAQQDTTPAAPAPQVAQRPPTIPLSEKGLAQKYDFVGNLIERSSSAKQLEKSGPPEARQIQQQAKDTRAQAKAALDAGELEKADKLLRDATQLMMKAVRMAHPEEVTAAKVKTDFNNRRDSVKTLLTTGKRVAGEKNASKPEFAKAEDLLKEAEALAADNKYAEGKSRLDQAYLLIKDAVRDMRGGEELTADKNFATKADEFKYEQARNDDYQGLIAGVIKGQTDPTWEEAAKKGRQLRDDADALGKSGEFEAALAKIGESTNQLKGILRRAGFPII